MHLALAERPVKPSVRAAAHRRRHAAGV